LLDITCFKTALTYDAIKIFTVLIIQTGGFKQFLQRLL